MLCGQNGSFIHIDNEEIRKKGFENIYEVYNKGINLQQELFYLNGKEYIESFDKINGHPFFLGKSFNQCHMKVSGYYFENISLKIDLYRNELIGEYPVTAWNKVHIILNKNQIDEVYLLDYNSGKVHWIIRIKEESAPDELMNQYVFKTHNGQDFQFFVHRKKIINLNNNSFTDKSTVYIRYKEDYHRIRNIRSITKLFIEHRKYNEIKNLLKGLDKKTMIEATDDFQLIMNRLEEIMNK